MVNPKTISLIVGIISSFLIQTQGADKYTDGNRPYEFGFNIEGEQHRHEKKDEKGLIMGEFGFITADGVYHVTVYATDEEGRFKILSMKNIRVKPYPTYKQPAGSARQGHSLDFQTPQQTLPEELSQTQKPGIPLKKILIEKPGKSCSSCSLPATTTQAPAPAIGQANVQNVLVRSNTNNLGQNPASVNTQYPQGAKANSFPGQHNVLNHQNVGSSASFLANQQNNFNNPKIGSQQNPTGNQHSRPLTPPEQGLVAPKQDSPNYSAINSHQTYPQEPVSSQVNPETPVSNYPQQPFVPSFSSQHSDAPQNDPSGSQRNPSDQFHQNVGTTQPQRFETDAQSRRNGNTDGRTAKKYDVKPQQTFSSTGARPNGEAGFNQGKSLPNKPTLISAQMQIIDKNTDIYQRGPGEREGLPNGLSKDDMSQLLYTFNYTVGFHGHFEEGYRNGFKQGYYYVTGRNGVRTRVDYEADAKGFRPKITQEVLDLLSDSVPKPETEKVEKYGLKGYEFKWLYFPVESNGR